MHSVRGADFGYRFRNGRKGLHPFTAWNGEVSRDSANACGDGRGTQRADCLRKCGTPHRIRRRPARRQLGRSPHRPVPSQAEGASYESVSEPIIVGSEEFRPVGLATAPDGSIYVTDWSSETTRSMALAGSGGFQTSMPALTSRWTSPRFESRRTIRNSSHTSSPPNLAERRVAARRLSDLNIRPLIALAQKADASTREKYEGVSALIRTRGSTTNASCRSMPPCRSPRSMPCRRSIWKRTVRFPRSRS